MTSAHTKSNASLLGRLKSVECPDSTFGGFQPPLVLADGLGSKVRDSEGREYIDLCAGFGTAILGHNHPVVREVFARQAQEGFSPVIQGMGDVYPSESKVALMASLSELLPSHLGVGALSVTGSQAVEFAVRTAHLATGRTKVLCFEGGYHGTDLGVLSYTHSDKFSHSFRGLYADNGVFAPFGASIAAIEALLAKSGVQPQELSAVLVEPIQGRAGTRMPPAGWLRDLAAWAKQSGALVIFDEVFTGMGRAGHICQAELSPCDILCIGKGLGGGMPLSACFSSPAIMASWPESQGEAQHTGTFFGHPLSCAVSGAVVDYASQHDLAARSLRLGDFIQQRLCRELPELICRGQGLMQALVGAPEFGLAMMNALRPRGVHALVSGADASCLALTPALTIPEDLLDQSLTAVIDTARSLPKTYNVSES